MLRWMLSYGLALTLAGGVAVSMAYVSRSGDGWAAFELDEVDRERTEQKRSYLEFFRAEDLSTGLSVLEAGADDPQSPHTEDEVYYIVGGKAKIRVGEEDVDVRPGSVVYVKAGVPHRFHEIEEELKILVVFAPAFGARR